jgi:hypothetical protein
MTHTALFDPDRQTLLIAPLARRQMDAWKIDQTIIEAVLRRPDAVIRDDGAQVRALRRQERGAVVVVYRHAGPDRLQIDDVQVQGYNGPLPLWRHLVRLPFYVFNRLIAARTNG